MHAEQRDLSALSRAPVAPSPVREEIPAPRRRWVTRYAVPGGLVSLAGLLLVYSGAESLMPATPVRVVPVLVRAGGITRGVVQAPGWVEADPYPTAVSALTEGIVREVLVLEGERVKAGQVVARLVDDEAKLGLQRTEAELDERRAALRTAEAAMNAAQRTWDNPVELQRKLGTAEASLKEREAELARWPSELAAAEAREKELGAECDRLTALHKEAQASDIEQIRADQQHEMQKAVVESTKARKAVLEAQIAFYRAELTAANDNLRLRITEQKTLEEAKAEIERAKAGVARAVAARDEARLRLERMEVRSPVDGVVMARLVEPGSKVMLATDMVRSAHVVRLYDPGRLQVRVDVPLGEAAKLQVGASAEIVVNVLPDRTFQGTVTRVVHEADIQKNTLQVKVAIDAPSPELKPEMLARARIATEAATSGPSAENIYAPQSLVKIAGDVATVWRVVGRKAVRQRVTVGAGRIDGWIEVREGLHAGDRLVADAPENLGDGSTIRIVGEANLSS